VEKTATQSSPAIDLNPLFRKLILGATNSGLVSGFIRRYGMRLGAARFVAGETLDECVEVLRGLNANGLATNTTLLGEGVLDNSAVEAAVSTYETILDRIAQEKLKTNVALKLTHIGLDLGEDAAYANIERLLERAATHGNFIRIDMEESARVDATLRIYRRLREAGHDNVGTVLQSYLFRTEEDLESLLDLEPNLRLVKGAYLESPEVAFPEKKDVDQTLVKLAERMLTSEGYTAVATHDDAIIDHLITFAEERGISRDRFEFQMLYGVRTQRQLELVQRGYKVLVATPYGPEWYFYLMRRLAERPANVLFMARNFFRG
jgi:proline dehydrogenase